MNDLNKKQVYIQIQSGLFYLMTGKTSLPGHMKPEPAQKELRVTIITRSSMISLFQCNHWFGIRRTFLSLPPFGQALVLCCLIYRFPYFNFDIVIDNSSNICHCIVG